MYIIYELVEGYYIAYYEPNNVVNYRTGNMQNNRYKISKQYQMSNS